MSDQENVSYPCSEGGMAFLALIRLRTLRGKDSRLRLRACTLRDPLRTA
jgi:hypothetical protein